MQLTRSGDYALRTMIQLASENSDKIVPINHISSKWNIPEKFLRKIVPILMHSGFIRSFRGNGGGIQMAISAD